MVPDDDHDVVGRVGLNPPAQEIGEGVLVPHVGFLEVHDHLTADLLGIRIPRDVVAAGAGPVAVGDGVALAAAQAVDLDDDVDLVGTADLLHLVDVLQAEPLEIVVGADVGQDGPGFPGTRLGGSGVAPLGLEGHVVLGVVVPMDGEAGRAGLGVHLLEGGVAVLPLVDLHRRGHFLPVVGQLLIDRRQFLVGRLLGLEGAAGLQFLDQGGHRQIEGEGRLLEHGHHHGVVLGLIGQPGIRLLVDLVGLGIVVGEELEPVRPLDVRFEVASQRGREVGDDLLVEVLRPFVGDELQGDFPEPDLPQYGKILQEGFLLGGHLPGGGGGAGGRAQRGGQSDEEQPDQEKGTATHTRYSLRRLAMKPAGYVSRILRTAGNGNHWRGGPGRCRGPARTWRKAGNRPAWGTGQAPNPDDRPNPCPRTCFRLQGATRTLQPLGLHRACRVRNRDDHRELTGEALGGPSAGTRTSWSGTSPRWKAGRARMAMVSWPS